MRLGLGHTELGAVAAIALALAAPIALGGCSAEVSVGGGSEASGEEIAEEIRGDYAERTGIELPKLTCEGVEGDVGARFSCSGRNARSVQLEIAGRVTDSGGDGFDYSWKVVEGVAPGVLYERALRGALERDGVAIAEVRCPVEVEIEVGSKLRCEATDRSGSSRGVTLHLTDLDGGFDYAVDGGAPADGSTSS
jgi:hypothetical protein